MQHGWLRMASSDRGWASNGGLERVGRAPDTPLHVVLVSSMFPPQVGGVETHVWELASRLSDSGHRVTVVNASPYNRADVREEIRPRCHVYRLAVPLRLAPSRVGATGIGLARKALVNLAAGKIIATIRSLEDVDIVHQHDLVSSIVLARIIAKQFPVVITNHTGEALLLHRVRSGRAVCRWLFRPFHSVIAPSKELARATMRPDAEYIPNGVDVYRFRPATAYEKARQRQRFGLPVRSYTILCARRWAPTKGIDVFVRALRTIVGHSNEPFTAVFAGSNYNQYPSYRGSVLQLIDDLGLRDKVVLLGDVPYSDMPGLFQASDVSVIPSHLEATSIAALESLASGVPVVGSSVGGLTDVVKDGLNGFLVRQGDSEHLGRSILRLMAMAPSERLQIAEQCTASAREYSWDRILQRILMVYASAMARCRADR